MIRKLLSAALAWALLLCAPALAAPVIYGPTTANSNAVTTRTLNPNFVVGHSYIADTFTTSNSANVTSIVNTSTTCTETGTTSWQITSAVNWNAGASSTKWGVCTPTANSTAEAVVCTWTALIGTKQFAIFEMDALGTWTIVHNNVDGNANPTVTSPAAGGGETFFTATYIATANTDVYTTDATFTNINGATNVAQTTRLSHDYKVASGAGTITYTGANTVSGSPQNRNWFVWGFLFTPAGSGSGKGGLMLRGVGR